MSWADNKKTVDELEGDFRATVKERRKFGITRKGIKKSNFTVILFDGEPYETQKGKRIWNQPSHAKLALLNDIVSQSYYHLKTREEQEEFKARIMARAQFIPVNYE